MEHSVQAAKGKLSGFMYRVYGLMTAAFAITGLTAHYVAYTPALFKPLFANPWAVFGIFFLQLMLVVALTVLLPRMNFVVATVLFFVYSASLGLVLSVVFLRFDIASIYVAFLSSALTFAAMAVYGYFTHSDLSGMGTFLLMGLMGLIMGLFINMFVQSSMFDLVLSSFGVIIFVALTAYDTQRIKSIGRLMIADGQPLSKAAVLGALTLYLDFINLFLYMLQLTGRRRD